jgi:hemolysin-activating ACP:hemolysin acyltransferase
MTQEKPTSSAFHVMRVESPQAALGRAVAYLMTKPNFESRPFGPWSKILTGQINRKHYFFVVSEKKVVGFAGWALTDKARALAWLNENAELSFENCQSGDSVIINAWAADNAAINKFIVKSIRRVIINRQIYAKRFYKDGSIRLLSLGANSFVQGHIDADTHN